MRDTLSRIILFTAFFLASLAASAQVEVLYVTEPHNENARLATYNVDPNTAIARRVGRPIEVGSQSVVPLTVGRKHVIYVWNSSDVWVYKTDAAGVPHHHPLQHLTFNFSNPVNTFLVDPDGKFAYAAVVSTDPAGYDTALMMLFTIDPLDGKLTDTSTVAGTYGPGLDAILTGFMFGTSGQHLYAASHTLFNSECYDPGYLYNVVDQNTGLLTPPATWLGVGAYCNGAQVATTDLVSAISSSRGGWGSGLLWVFYLNGGTIFCTSSMLEFCGDDAVDINLDPANQNIFFGDGDRNRTYVGRLEFVLASRHSGTIRPTPVSIPGTPPIFFSPDSRLVYALDADDIGIYAFQPDNGDLTAHSSLPTTGSVTIATTVLPD